MKRFAEQKTTVGYARFERRDDHPDAANLLNGERLTFESSEYTIECKLNRENAREEAYSHRAYYGWPAGWRRQPPGYIDYCKRQEAEWYEPPHRPSPPIRQRDDDHAEASEVTELRRQLAELRLECDESQRTLDKHRNEHADCSRHQLQLDEARGQANTLAAKLRVAENNLRIKDSMRLAVGRALDERTTKMDEAQAEARTAHAKAAKLEQSLAKVEDIRIACPMCFLNMSVREFTNHSAKFCNSTERHCMYCTFSGPPSQFAEHAAKCRHMTTPERLVLLSCCRCKNTTYTQFREPVKLECGHFLCAICAAAAMNEVPQKQRGFIEDQRLLCYTCDEYQSVFDPFASLRKSWFGQPTEQ